VTRLLWRVFAANAVLLAAGTLVLVLSPATVSRRVVVAEAVVLVVGVAAILVINLLLLRPVFRPLERLAARMATVDLLQPGERVGTTGTGEVAALERAFDDMLGRLESERRESGSRTLAAQEAERLRIARGLHDEVGQTMTGVLFALRRLADRVPEAERPAVEEVQEAVRGSLEEVRRIAQELRPAMLDHLGLSRALGQLARTFGERTGIAVTRRVDPDLPALEPAAELALYRVAQEALTNVARHARASSVELGLRRSGDRVELRVADDGAGFPADVVEGGGLRGIRERALMLGGALQLGRSASGGGELRFAIPAGA
jgi:two-component system sensor histidine kinase UhpB